MGRIWKVWLWLAYAYAAWILISTSIRAFSSPWRWTPDQIFVALIWAALIAVAARWGRIWWRGGYPEVRAQWKKHMARSSVLTSKRWYLSLAFWIVVALLLVAFFNMQQQRGG
jgi:hypothetical protein